MFIDAGTRRLFPLRHALVELFDEVVTNLAATVVVVIELGIDSLLST